MNELVKEKYSYTKESFCSKISIQSGRSPKYL